MLNVDGCDVMDKFNDMIFHCPQCISSCGLRRACTHIHIANGYILDLSSAMISRICHGAEAFLQTRISFDRLQMESVSGTNIRSSDQLLATGCLLPEPKESTPVHPVEVLATGKGNKHEAVDVRGMGQQNFGHSRHEIDQKP